MLEVTTLSNHLLEPLINEYLEDKDITKESLALYKTILKQYISYLKEHQILDATTDDVIHYIKWKKSQGYSTRWIHLQMSTIKGLYKYLSLHQKRLTLTDEYSIDITESIQNEHINHHQSHSVLTIEQAKHLILSNKQHRKYMWHYRDYAIIYLMLTTGLRSVEIRRARKKDLSRHANQWVLYVQGKGKKSSDVYVKLTIGVEEAISDYLSKRKDKNPYLFVSHSHHGNTPYLSRTFFNEMFKRVLRVAGLSDLKMTPHCLRHTAATINLLRGGSIEETKRLLRHTNLSATLIYSHHLDPMKDDVETKLEEFILKEYVPLENERNDKHDDQSST
jgi:site-specific recombinase XerD